MEETGKIAVVINGLRREIETGLTVSGLLERLGVPPVGTAVELDGCLLAPAQWSACVLRPEQKIEIVRLVGGG